ncbi:hypothetical protein [Polymorphum gilvum]|uniref:hypothetical protein n=1 Tax=Polymorphum gilvum TaxID=991904 RepID=UPI0002D44439|nr:hypothetical protein [Polymorphum gilvum]
MYPLWLAFPVYRRHFGAPSTAERLRDLDSRMADFLRDKERTASRSLLDHVAAEREQIRCRTEAGDD